MVNGYPFTFEDGFAYLACESLRARGYDLELACLAPAKTTQLSRFGEAIEQHLPAVTVLQLGGLETLLLLEDTIRGWFGTQKPKRIYDQHLHTSPFRTPWLKFKWRVMSTLKRIADTLLLHPIVNLAEFRENLRAALEFVRDKTNGSVLVMGLIPSADPVSQFYRDRMAPIFIEECARANVHFLNIAEAWRKDGLNSSYAHDPIHINVRGHAWLALHLAQALVPILQQAGKPRGETVPVQPGVSYSAPGSCR
jgi:lysophospholipase L1-like esterase